MAYDTVLGDRMRSIILTRPGTIEKNMFGGLGFFIHGNMWCGVWKDMMVVRLTPEDAEKALKKPHARVFDITGKPMRGWLLIEPAGCKNNVDLLAWVEASFAFVSTLPQKK